MIKASHRLNGCRIVAPAFRSAMLLLALLIAGGCSASPGAMVHRWQREVERYVVEQGGGNPAVLQAAGDGQAYRRIPVYGDATGMLQRQRSDAVGMLVGMAQIQGAPWYVFVVGVNQYQGELIDVDFDRPTLKQMRLAAFTPRRGELVWALGPADPESMAAYIAAQSADWQRDPERAGQSHPNPRFPTPYDRYRVEPITGAIRVVETRSGARWEMDLPRVP